MSIDQINTDRLSKVHPWLSSVMHQVIGACATQGVPVLITQGLRTWQEQDALYGQGRTSPGKKVTNARGGQSYHNFGLAVDFVPVDAIGKADWNVGHPAWSIVVGIAKQHNLEWGGDWVSFKDFPHLQVTAGLTLPMLRKIYSTGGLDACWKALDQRLGL